MCGICGIVNLDPSDPVDGMLIKRMTGILAHRGPNDAGYFVESNVGLGHRRLSIIDLSGGRQPIFNEDGSALTVFNGEIYNFADLTSTLLAHGHTFKTRSDTEAIIHAYEQYGDEFVNRLRGMFAFAIWDRRQRRLLLARDRLGKKPLYFHLGNTFFAFASEIKALLELPDVPRRVDPEALDLYLSLRYVPGPRTMFKDIFKLQPGHLLVLDQTGIHVRKYWDVEYQRDYAHSPEDYQKNFEQLLEESVRLRLISEVPLGIFLSGGLDSSAILAMMSKATGGQSVKSFSVGYQAAGSQADDVKDANEFEYARQAASAFRAEHHEFRLGAADFQDFIPQLVWHLDEPLADPSCIPLYFISKLAREHITVVLSGEGADEILAGYNIYRRMLALESVYNRLGPLTAWLAPLTPGSVTRNYVRLAGLPLEARYRGVSRGLSPGLKGRLLPGYPAEERLHALFTSYFDAVEGTSPLDRMLYLDLKVWLPDDLLLKADKMTMANGLELRVPFLDHKLVEFAATLPAGLKLNQGRGKWLLRQAMRGIVPEAIIERPKKGFPVPTESWLRVHLRDFTHTSLLGRDSACRLYLDSRVLEEIVRHNELGWANRHQDIWTLLVFEFWHRIFIEQRLRPAGSQDYAPIQ